MALSKLKKIDLREEWKHEAADFTKWLVQDENLQLLSEEIGEHYQFVNGFGLTFSKKMI
jgi:hypothetical protein